MLKLLLIWTSLTTLIFWLPAVRGAFDGASYEWAVMGSSGNGTHGAYWLPLLASVVSIAGLWSGWRGPRAPSYLLLGGWHLFLAIGTMVAVLQDPDGFHVRGDTMGMDIDLAVMGPVFFGIWALLALWWIARDLRRKKITETFPWTVRNRRWLVVLAGLLPIQLVLLRLGGPDDALDPLGVTLTIAQWMLLGAAFAPKIPRAKHAVAPKA